MRAKVHLEQELHAYLLLWRIGGCMDIFLTIQNIPMEIILEIQELVKKSD